MKHIVDYEKLLPLLEHAEYMLDKEPAQTAYTLSEVFKYLQSICQHKFIPCKQDKQAMCCSCCKQIIYTNFQQSYDQF